VPDTTSQSLIFLDTIFNVGDLDTIDDRGMLCIAMPHQFSMLIYRFKNNRILSCVNFDVKDQ
jgi:hypothetical protein